LTARRFYVGFLGLEVWRDWETMTLFRSPAAPGAQVIASTRLACPVGFELMIDSLERLEAIHRAAQGRSVVLHNPCDFPEQGVRCFLLLDPNGIGVNLAAPLQTSG
jgi:catechol 2,3-dioxygenase-like lactoylglutathione lyase family enzyme